MTNFEHVIQLLDECDDMIAKINASLKQQIKEEEDELIMIRAEKIVKG